MIAVLILLVIFSSIFGIFYVFFTTRNKERITLIEKGADAKLFNTGKVYDFKNATLSLGMFLIGVGLGIMAGALLKYHTMLDPGAAYTLGIFFFAGLSLIIYFFLARNLDKKES